MVIIASAALCQKQAAHHRWPCFPHPSAGCGAKEQEQQKPDANLTEYQQTFEDFLDEQFIDALSGSTISLHYHLKNPEEYGLNTLPVDAMYFFHLFSSLGFYTLSSLL